MLVEIERFVNWVRRRSPEARTWRDYGYDLRIFVAAVGDRPPREVTFREVDDFISQQAERGFKPSTINRRLASVISLYAFLAPEDDELVCPVMPHRHHLRQPQRLPRPVQEDDLRRFFAVVNDARDRAMFTLMLRCGLRIAEVANLQLADLYLDEDFPRLVTRGKGSRERAAYLSSQAVHILREYLAVRPCAPSDFVFLSYQLHGLSTTAIHKRLMRYRERAGLSLTAHRLRHSFANDLLNADVPITSIQKLMGHRWIESTQTYVMANDQQVREDYYAACQKLEHWLPTDGSHVSAA
jgi:site-specific recombinase XerD